MMPITILIRIGTKKPACVLTLAKLLTLTKLKLQRLTTKIHRIRKILQIKAILCEWQAIRLGGYAYTVPANNSYFFF